MASHQTCPYRSVSDYQRWDKAQFGALDPYFGHTPRFSFDRATKIVTAGSCFAQNIARRLRQLDYTYLMTEPDPSLTAFSARYGNIYTVAHLNQLIDRAYGRFTPAEDHWQVGERFFDPYRPSVDAEGFASLEDLRAARETHLAAVRTALETCDVFIFTLGLTEAWVNRTDDAVYPVCPGCGFGTFSAEKYAFRNYTAAEVSTGLGTALQHLRKINPRVKVILTVSPVPLAATMEPRHVVLSTAYSKSVLRIACEDAARAFDFVDYFASYEIVNWGREMSSYFSGDLRTVSDDGINHVMRVFFRHYANHVLTDPAAVGAKAWCDDDLLLHGSLNVTASVSQKRKLTADEEYAEEQKHASRGYYAKKFEVTAQRQPHPFLGWKNNPGDQVLFGRTLDASGYYNSRNIADFMGPKYRRVCVVGPSIIMDLENEEKDTICGFMQQELYARGYPHVFVYNCGIQGSNTAMDLSNLLHYVVHFSPDVVVAASGGNDIRGNISGDPRPGYPSSFFLWERILKSFRVEGMPPNVNAFLEGFDYNLGELRDKVGFGSHAWFKEISKNFQFQIFKMRKLAEGFDFGCLSINPPTRGTHRINEAQALTDGHPFMMDQVNRIEFYGRQLPRLAERNKFGALNLSSLLDDLEPDDAFTDTIHMKPVGYQRVARQIVENLIENFPDRLAAP